MNTGKRDLIHVSNSEAVTDGDGVKIQRNVAHRALQTYDPFLLLDEIAADDAADYIGGFPEHPHRGFETVTYMLEGSMQHRDHLGNEGLLESGGVQWMTAGRGVLHSEMPMQDQGRMHGFQLWVNLPSAQKMSEPNYREFDANAIPEVALNDGGQVRVIAGDFRQDGETVSGPVRDVATQPDYFDIQLSANTELQLPVDSDKRVLIYVFEGAIKVAGKQGERPLRQQQLGMLGDGDTLSILAEQDSRLLLLAGRPIGEPIANWGPFVMNTPEEIEQAIRDYRNGELV